MGYLLPIQPIQSQQYANRMNIEPYNFAYIGRIHRATLTSDFLEEFKEQSQLTENGENSEEQSFVPQTIPNTSYIQPNPVNLSPAIAAVVGKGMNINKYV